MKLCVAQMKPITGDIAGNMERHCEFVEKAASMGAEMLVFPELSLTGYEPRLARELAMAPNDQRLGIFEEISGEKKMVVAVGLPTGTPAGLNISMMIFRPEERPLLYSKRYLHADERAFFVCGRNIGPLDLLGHQVAFAICFELSVGLHAKTAANKGAKIYVASVAKSAAGLEQASERLAEIATTHSMTVVMSNCVGPCHDFEGGGCSSAWDSQGKLLGQLPATGEGLLLLDTATGDIEQK